jgi:putative glycerol-1-phosphate prenyltransferase
MTNVFRYIISAKKKGKKLFAVLIDPDKFNPEVVRESNRCKVDLLFIGGSGLQAKKFHQCMQAVRRLTKIPVVIFPGGREQISEKADAILLLSLISGRNPDYLIGEHIRAAKQLKKSKLEIIPTGYILVNGGKKVSTHTVSRTSPIIHSDTELAASTAIAGELLGMKLIYLEAGSGANKTLSSKMIRSVKKNISCPVIVGGGIDSAKKAKELCLAGADVIVVGNAIEKDCTLIRKISHELTRINTK